MSPDRARRAAALFRAAIRLEGAERARFLDRECSADADLRREVDELLDLDGLESRELPGAFVPQGWALRAARLDRAPPEPLPPSGIDGYRIVGKIGEGGMGVVFEAIQDVPHRRVALKLIRRGLSDSASRRRFEFETEVLGRLQHEGIARIYDAGTAEADGDRRPWFAMELVDGEPISRHARRTGLDLFRRIDLVCRVCEAVQHAHQRGVIHRDLKPGNVLVDGSGRPKVLDFGVARVAGGRGDGGEPITEPGKVLGTLAYMSPEQARGDRDEVDTRADVYSLGVLTYELLAGRPPLELEDLGVLDAARAIQEREPPRLGELDPRMRGDLETIVSKAMDKDPDRRYGTASDLAADLRRFLDDEPVEARPPSRIYRLRKLVRRHRRATAGSIAVLVLLAAGAIATWRQADRARRAEHRATAMNEFLLDELFASPTEHALGPRTTVRELLERAADRLEGSFDEDPATEADLLAAVGGSLTRLSALERALPLLARAHRLRSDLVGDDDPESSRAAVELASCLQLAGRPVEALELAREARAALELVVGRSDPAAIRALAVEAQSLSSLGEQDEAIERQEEVVAATAAEPAQRAYALSMLSLFLTRRGDLERAEGPGRDAHELAERELGSAHPTTLLAAGRRAQLLSNTGRAREAMELLDRSIETMERTLGLDHMVTLNAKGTLAHCRLQLGRYVDASRLATELIEGLDSNRELGHTFASHERMRLGLLCLRLGRSAEAERLLAADLESARRAQGVSALDLAIRLREHGQCLLQLGRTAEAEPRLREAERRLEEAGLDPHPTMTRVRSSIAELHIANGRNGEAEALLREVLDAHAEQLGDDSPQVVSARATLARHLMRTGRHAEAEPLLRRSLEQHEELFPDDGIQGRDLAHFLGDCLRAMGMLDEAEVHLLRSHELAERVTGPDSRKARGIAGCLALLYRKAGLDDEASEWARRSAGGADPTAR